jgi:hypothetical protein
MWLQSRLVSVEGCACADALTAPTEATAERKVPRNTGADHRTMLFIIQPTPCGFALTLAISLCKPLRSGAPARPNHKNDNGEAGGEGGIRTVSRIVLSASCRFHVARGATVAIRATPRCPTLPDGGASLSGVMMDRRRRFLWPTVHPPFDHSDNSLAYAFSERQVFAAGQTLKRDSLVGAIQQAQKPKQIEDGRHGLNCFLPPATSRLGLILANHRVVDSRMRPLLAGRGFRDSDRGGGSGSRPYTQSGGSRPVDMIHKTTCR